MNIRYLAKNWIPNQHDITICNNEMNSLQSTVLTSSNKGLFLALDGDDDDSAFKQRLEDLVIGARTWIWA